MQDTLNPTRRTLTVCCWALMIFSPFVLLAVISLITGHNAFVTWPVWSNELGCWQSLSSWNAVGLASGYNGYFEAVPAIGAQGVYGFSPILIYGWFVKLFGLAPNTIVICNAVWISLALMTFCAIHRPKPLVSLGITALLCCYTPAILYCVTSMTELFDYALVIFYIAFVLKYYQTKSPWTLALSLLTVIFACFYRITFFLLFFPLAWLFGGSRISWKTAAASALLLLIAMGCYFLSGAFTSPNQQGFLYNLLNADSLKMALQMLLSHTKSNYIDYVNFYHADHVQWAFRQLYLFVMILCLFGSFWKRQKGGFKLSLGFQKEVFVCFLWLLAQLVIIMVLFETYDWADFRILAPLLWLVPVWLLVSGHRTMPAAAMAGILLLLVPLIQYAPMGAYQDAARFDPPAVEERYANAAACIIYDPNADDPFDNTVRTDLIGWPLLATLNPGLGLEYGWFTPETIGQSRWLLTDTLKMPIEGYTPVYKERGIAVYRLEDTE